MKKFWLTRFIIIFFCASIAIGCRTTKPRPITDKNDDTSDRQKRGMFLPVSITTDTPTSGDNEAELVSTTIVNEISDNVSITNTKSHHNTTSIVQETEFNEDKRSEGGDNPLPSSDEEEIDEIKSRKTRQKTYKCYCEEASYRSDCLKKCQSAKQYVEDDYSQESFIEMTEDPLETYTNKVPRTTTEPAKFSIPYAKHVNFDQRVILGNEYPQSYNLYSRPQIKIPTNHLFPIYPQTPQLQYAIAYPGMVHNGISPLKQNYLTSALKKPAPKGAYMPSVIGRNFANIQECIKLYGKTVCVIAPTTKSPMPNSEITTVDVMTGNAVENNINKIDEPCTDNNQNQNVKTTGYPKQLIYQTNTMSPLYEIKYPSVHDPKLKSSVKIDKLYSIGSNPPKSPNYYVSNKQQPYANHFNYGKNIFLNNGQNKNLQKSFNGKYYLNKNNMNIAQATSTNNNGMEKQLYYLQTPGVTTPRPITQKPVYATKYAFPTTPSYAYLDEYGKSRSEYSKEIVNSKESKDGTENRKNYEHLTNYKNGMNGNAGQNRLQDSNIRHQTLYPPYTQKTNHETFDHSNNQNYYFEDGRQTTRHPMIQLQYSTTMPNIRHDYVQDSKFVTNQPIYRYNEYQNNQQHSLLDGIQSIVGNKYTSSQEGGNPNYPNLLEETTISPLLQPTSIYVTDQQQSDYHSRYEENLVSSSLQKNYENINKNYNLAKTNNNFAQGLSPSNTEKDRKLFFSNKHNYNSDVKVASTEINSHTSKYVSNGISEDQLVEQTTEDVIHTENALQPNSENRDSSEFVTSIRKEYDSDNSKLMNFNHAPKYNHQATYDNVNYYKSDSAQSRDNELYYSSNEALEHEKYKNNERPQPQFDYSNFPQSMSRIINVANGQYKNNEYPQYHTENILKEYPNNHIYDGSNKNYNNDYIAKTVIPKTDFPDTTSFVDRNIPIYTTISMSHTTPPTLNYNNKGEMTKNQGFYYPTTYAYNVRNGRPPINYEYQDRYDTRLPLQSFNSKNRDMVEHPEQFGKGQITNVKLNTKFDSNTYTSKTNSALFQDTTKSITTLETLENDEFRKHYNPIRTSTVRSADSKISEPIIQSRKKYPSKLSKQKIRLNMFNDTENLFRGLEQIILNNYDPVLSEENIKEPVESSAPKESTQINGSKKIAENILFGDANEKIMENVRKYGQAGVLDTEYNKFYAKGTTGTENPIQAVDDIPATVRDDIYSELTTRATIDRNETPQQTANELLVQNTIRKVINNFVPGKAEDLMANYENKNAKELVAAKVSDLLPEIIGIPILKNLLGISEIENMIVDVAGGLMGRLTNIAVGNLIGLIRKSFRRVVDNEIPQPNPTMVPYTVEEHRFENGEWVTEQVSLLGSSKTDELKNIPRKIFDKIKSILSRSKLSEEEATHPVVQNLIVKAVKHALDKEGLIQESAIRRAFKIIVKPVKGKISPPYKPIPSTEAKKATIPVPEDTTASYGSYKLAPIIPIKENNVQNGHWKESQKLLVDPKEKEISTGFDENAKKALQKQLDKVKKIKVKNSEEKENRYTEISDINFETSSEYEYEDEGERDYEDEYSLIGGNAKEKVSLNHLNDETIDRQPIKYYSPTDRILEYIKTHQLAANPSFSTTAEIIGRTNEYDTTTPTSNAKDSHLSPQYKTEVTKKPSRNTKPKQWNSNQIQFLFESPKAPAKPKSKPVTNDTKKLGQNNQIFGASLTEYSPQSANNSQTYMGKLVPVDEKASRAKNLSDLENSNLVYVGDGVRLPLTIRKMTDGTFALSLSDEIYKQFLQKQCPCCLQNKSNGSTVRHQKSIKDVPEWNFSSNDQSEETATEKINSNTDYHFKLQRRYNKDTELFDETTPTEYLVAHHSPHSDSQQESERQIKITPSKIKQNLDTKIHSRFRRESEERKEVAQTEKFTSHGNFMENHVETSMEDKDKALLVNVASSEKTIQKDSDHEGLQVDDNMSEPPFDYEQDEPFDLGLHVIPRMIGPYRYQQLYAKENADALRNMLYMMQGIDSPEE